MKDLYEIINLMEYERNDYYQTVLKNAKDRIEDSLQGASKEDAIKILHTQKHGFERNTMSHGDNSDQNTYDKEIKDYINKKLVSYGDKINEESPRQEELSNSTMMNALGSLGTPQVSDNYLIAGGIALALGALGWHLFKKWKDGNNCDKLQGSEKYHCQLKAIDQVISKIESGSGKCSKDKNPSLCRKKISKIISDWKSKKKALEMRIKYAER